MPFAINNRIHKRTAYLRPGTGRVGRRKHVMSEMGRLRLDHLLSLSSDGIPTGAAVFAKAALIHSRRLTPSCSI